MEHPQIDNGEEIEFEFLCPTLESAVEVAALGNEAGCIPSTIQAVHETSKIVYWLKLILKNPDVNGRDERVTAQMVSIADETRTSFRGCEPYTVSAMNELRSP